MRYLPGTTLNEPISSAAELTLTGVQTWPTQVAKKAEKNNAYIPAFARSLKQMLAPAAARSFFAELESNDMLLCHFGWILLLSVPAFATLSFFDPGAAHMANPWFKPIKFAISFSTFVWTVSLFLLRLRIPSRLLKATRLTMVASITIEMVCLSVQAWRITDPSAVAGLGDWLVQQMTTAMVSVNTAILVGLLA